jgi:ATP-dependent Lon protease
MSTPQTTASDQQRAPLIALKNKVVFPGELVSLVFERESSVTALNTAVDNQESPIFVFQKQPEHEISTEDLYEVGTKGRIVRVWRMPEGPMGALIEGEERESLTNITQENGYFQTDYEPLAQHPADKTEAEVEALMRYAKHALRDLINQGMSAPLGMLNEVFSEDVEPGRLVNLTAAVLNIANKGKQDLLETEDVFTQLQSISQYLAKEKEVMDMEEKVQQETQKQMGKQAKENMLREQMKAIEKELGSGSQEQSEYDEIEDAVENADMPDEVKKKARKELSKLKKMPPFSPESSNIQNYLEVLTDMPWGKTDQTSIDLDEAQTVLDEDHYGLPDVKDRILEYLAVEKLNDKPQGSILCFVGPPGTGKTSIGKSIARTTGREFSKVSLGGVRDETEIRGHRRTYVGAMPGRIIQGIRNAKTSNPVMMLDEIDKLGADFRGDPSSALLEVLDPAQNKEYTDHYLDVPFDLSDVIFITTANELSTVPEPLLDRMEVIDFTGYTDREKLEIAKRYLVPRVLEQSGLSANILSFTDNALLRIIRRYTYEAGVRNLEREIAKIARKVAKEYLIKETEDFSMTVSVRQVNKYLRGEKYEETLINKKNEVGIATGLAWTPTGGDILFVETNIFAGEGQLTLTGQLGKVMQESAQAAYSYIKANAKAFGIDPAVFKSKDIHVHVPAGAIPKDGPSAGQAMATSIVSALTGQPVRREVGMTGEINLRGQTLRIGGVKNKVLAAHRAGATTVILPKANKQDLEELPPQERRKMNFVFAEHFEDVYQAAFEDASLASTEEQSQHAEQSQARAQASERYS